MKRAVEWVTEQFRKNPAVPVGFLVASASQQFELSSADLGFLCRLLEGGPWH